ncbi:Hsp70 family protein, partial [Streptomyces sp. NPDC035033]|uniref:Hsp70 family protein n=1 Tax=Streptomyces sp. NPDC035033 TaxID=3155368 RepID=UPI0034021CB9
ANGIMHVTAKDLGTGKEQKMTVTGGSSLPKDDIDRMVREAERHAAEDRARKEAAETRNRGENLVHQTEKLLRENAAEIPGDVRAEVEAAVAEVKEKLGAAGSAAGRDGGEGGEGGGAGDGDGDTAAVRAAVDRLGAAAQKIGSALYARAQGAAGAGGKEEGKSKNEGEGEGEGEDIVDAEIVDEDKREESG